MNCLLNPESPLLWWIALNAGICACLFLAAFIWRAGSFPYAIRRFLTGVAILLGAILGVYSAYNNVNSIVVDFLLLLLVIAFNQANSKLEKPV